jgi:Peroxidase
MCSGMENLKTWPSIFLSKKNVFWYEKIWRLDPHIFIKKYVFSFGGLNSKASIWNMLYIQMQCILIQVSNKTCYSRLKIINNLDSNWNSPNKLDDQYYKNVKSLTALFFSDWSLLTSPETAQQVDTYSKVPGAFESDFIKAMVKMGSVEVLTGSQGEIRGPTCRAVIC